MKTTFCRKKIMFQAFSQEKEKCTLEKSPDLFIFFPFLHKFQHYCAHDLSEDLDLVHFFLTPLTCSNDLRDSI